MEVGRRGQILDVFFFKLEMTGFPDDLEGGERKAEVGDASNVPDATTERMEFGGAGGGGREG